MSHPTEKLTEFQRKIYDATGIDSRTDREIAEKAGFFGAARGANVTGALRALKRAGLVLSTPSETMWWRSAL